MFQSRYLDRGSEAVLIDGKFRTSILTTPVNGRIQPMTSAGQARMQGLQNDWEYERVYAAYKSTFTDLERKVGIPLSKFKF